MATIDRYKIQLDVAGQQAVDSLASSIGKLGGLIAGIGFGAFIGNALRAADAIVDLGKATGFTAGEVKVLADALQEAGGDAKDVDKVLTTFYNTLGDAANGSEKAVDALEKLGIVQKDLTTLSEGALFNKAIEGLAKLEQGALRTSVGMDIFGKAFRSVDPRDLQQALQAADPSKFTSSLESAARQVQMIETSYRNLQMAALNVIQQLTGSTGDFTISLEKAEKIIKGIAITLGVVFGVQAIAMLTTFITQIYNLNKALAGTALITNILGKNPLIKVIAGLAIAAGLGADSWKDYEKSLEKVNEEIDKLNKGGAQPPPAAPSAPTGEPTGPRFGESGKGPAFATARQTAEQRAMALAAETARQTTNALAEQNLEALKYQQIVNGTIGMHSNLAAMITQEAQIEQDARNKILDLEKQIAIERAKEKPNVAVIEELGKQKILTEETKNAQIKLNEERFRALETVRATAMELERTTMTQTRKVELDLMRQQIEGMKAVTLEEQTALKIAQIAGEEKKKLIELQKELTAAQRAGDMQAITDIQERIRLETDYYDKLKQMENSRMQQELANREDRMLGINRSLEQIARQYDPIRVAADQTTLLFDRMGQGLEEFVTKGKLNFKNFALSLIRDMLMIQVKAQAMNFMRDLFGSGLTGGGIVGSLLGGLFGLAKGGPAQANIPYIVGEKGPELFVPKSPGTVIPNDAMGAPGNYSKRPESVNAPITNNFITNNINALDAKSVAQLFVENRKTLLGSVNMAKKEMPYSMA